MQTLGAEPAIAAAPARAGRRAPRSASSSLTLSCKAPPRVLDQLDRRAAARRRRRRARRRRPPQLAEPVGSCAPARRPQARAPPGRAARSRRARSARSSAPVSTRRRARRIALAPLGLDPLALLARRTARAQPLALLAARPPHTLAASAHRLEQPVPRRRRADLAGQRAPHESWARVAQLPTLRRRRAPAPARRPAGSAARTPRASVRLDPGRRRARRPARPRSGASKRTTWQRERIVGSTSPSRSVIRIRCTNEAGSSSVFSIRLAASSPSSSARSITNTRRDDSNGVLRGGRDHRLVDVGDEDLVRAARDDPGEVGVCPGQRARLRAGRIGRALRQQPRGELARERRACRPRPARGTDRRATGAPPARAPAPSTARALRMALELRQHPTRLVDRGCSQLQSTRRMSERGRLITIEGIDGAGKTTLARGLQQALQRAGSTPRLMREPGGVEAVRADPRARQGPGAADRRPRRGAALRGRAGAARRGGARARARRRRVGAARPLRRLLAGLPGRGPRARVDAVRELNLFATGGLTPDRTLLLTLDPASAHARARCPRRDAPGPARAGGRRLLRRGSPPPTGSWPPPSRERIRVLDAALPPEQVVAQALAGACYR